MLLFFNIIYDFIIKKPSSFIQRHFILSLFIIICLCFIITFIIFLNDTDIQNPNFNRDHTIKIINNKRIKQYTSSTFTDTLHYVLTTFSTVGYGDITPISSNAKIWTNIMQLVVIIITLKLFDYISSDDSVTLQYLIKRIQNMSSEITNLERENLELKHNIEYNQIQQKPSVQKAVNIFKKRSTISVNN